MECRTSERCGRLSSLTDMSDRIGAVSDPVKLRCGETETGECYWHPSNLSVSKNHPDIRDMLGTQIKWRTRHR